MPPADLNLSDATDVTVVITTFNHAHYLRAAIDSCLAQTRPARQIIVVDDGSTDSPHDVVASYNGIMLLRQPNRGLSAARNTGLRKSTTPFIIFLDADDRLLPYALEVGLNCFASHPEATFVYGAYRNIDDAGRSISSKKYVGPSRSPLLQFLEIGNFIGMHATVLYRRERLVAFDGFNESLRACEDYDLLMRIAKTDKVASHDVMVAEYRQHTANMSRNNYMMLDAALRALNDNLSADAPPEQLEAAARGRVFLRNHYAVEDVWAGLRRFPSAPLSGLVAMLTATSIAPVSVARALMQRSRRWLARRAPGVLSRILGGPDWRPKFGRVWFGDYSRTEPISGVFGFDRGEPIDRYYIRSFLSENADAIGGRVLEVQDSGYTEDFGGTQVTHADVVDIDPTNSRATIRGNLELAGTLPDDAFDCIILTQTLHLMFDFRSTLANLSRALKPQGILLITVPGITPLDREESNHTWHWSFTPHSIERLLREHFAPSHVATRAYGNVFAATSFLHGLSASEVARSKLDVTDNSFPVIVAARAAKGHAT